MFSLIISVISIALVAAIAVATTYYMGTVAIKQQAKADASQFMMAGEQIAAAFTLSTFSGGNPNIWINSLVPEYLVDLAKEKLPSEFVEILDVGYEKVAY